MDPQFFKRKEDRLWWTAYLRGQIDLLGQRCAAWITETMADGHVYNRHPSLWRDDGKNIECYFLIDTDRFGSIGVNFLYLIRGVVSPDSSFVQFEVITGVTMDGRSQQKYRVETADPFENFDPETLFPWITSPNAGLDATTNELGMEAQLDASPVNVPPTPTSPEDSEKSLEQASLQELLDAMRRKIDAWTRFDLQVQQRLRS